MAKRPDDLVIRAIERLNGDDPTLRTRWVEIWLDHFLAQPVSDLVDVGSVAVQIQAGMSAEAVRRWRTRVGDPGMARARTRWADSDETLGDWLPDEAIDELRSLFASPGFPRLRWARGAVSPSALSGLLAPALQEVLLGFVKRLSKLRGEEGGKGRPASRFDLRGRVKASVHKRGEQLVGAGKSVLGGLSMGFEERLRSTARDFSGTASTTLRTALADRMRSEAGTELVAKIRVQIFERLLETPLHELAADLDGLDPEIFWSAVGHTADHLGALERFDVLLLTELRATLDLEGSRTVGEVLDDVGDLSALRHALVTQAEPLARDLFGHAEFQKWLRDLLT